MEELWDIYDTNRQATGRLAKRETYKFQKGEFHLITVAVIINSQKQILIAKRSETKKREPLKWELTGGGVRAGENTLQAILRETMEEIGLKFEKDDAIFLKEIKEEKETGSGIFKDFWIFKSDAKIEEITFPDKEAKEAKWVTIEELLEMQQNNKMISGLNFEKEDYELALKKLQKS